MYNIFMKMDTPATEFDVVNQILMDLERAYSDLQVKHSDYIETLEDEVEEENKIICETNIDMEKIYEELCTVRVTIAAKKRSVVNSESEVRVKPKLDAKLGIKKLEAPKFYGGVRDYPMFKKDYEAHMIPIFGKDPYALRSCLHGKASEAVKGLGDNFEELHKTEHGAASLTQLPITSTSW